MADDAPLGRTRWLDPDSDTVAAALRAYHGDDESWREPFRTRQAENLERHCMALALETALPDPRAGRVVWGVHVGSVREEPCGTVWVDVGGIRGPMSRDRARPAPRLVAGDFVTTIDEIGAWEVIEVRHTNTLNRNMLTRTLDLVVRPEVSGRS